MLTGFVCKRVIQGETWVDPFSNSYIGSGLATPTTSRGQLPSFLPSATDKFSDYTAIQSVYTSRG